MGTSTTVALLMEVVTELAMSMFCVNGTCVRSKTSHVAGMLDLSKVLIFQEEKR